MKLRGRTAGFPLQSGYLAIGGTVRGVEGEDSRVSSPVSGGNLHRILHPTEGQPAPLIKFKIKSNQHEKSINM